MLELTDKNVESVFMNCLYDDDVTDHTGHIRVEGVIANFGFDPVKVDKNKELIRELLDQLPDQFQEKIGGGWSFLQACMTKDDNLWGEHRNVEQLLAIGIASNQAAYCMDRQYWSAMPGGVPYFIVLDSERIEPYPGILGKLKPVIDENL